MRCSHCENDKPDYEMMTDKSKVFSLDNKTFVMETFESEGETSVSIKEFASRGVNMVVVPKSGLEQLIWALSEILEDENVRPVNAILEDALVEFENLSSSVSSEKVSESESPSSSKS